MFRPIAAARPTVLALACLASHAFASTGFDLAMDKDDRRVVIQVQPDGKGAVEDVPVGTYHADFSDLVITGHQVSHVVASGLTNAMVAAAAEQAAYGNAKAAHVEEVEPLLHLTFTDETRADVAHLLAESEAMKARYTTKNVLSLPRLKLATAALLTYTDDGRIQPTIFVKATLTEPNERKPSWENRYFVTTGEPRAIKGPDSWTANEAASLKANLSASLKEAVAVALADVDHATARDKETLSVATVRVPFEKPKVEVLAYRVGEDAQYVSFVPKVGEEHLFAGVNVVEKSAVTWRVAKADDKDVTVVVPPIGTAGSLQNSR
jgi:hypothetical protein